MSIGSFLLTKDNLALVKKKSWKFGRPEIIDLGMRYYDAHPDEVAVIAQNLAYMGLPNSDAALDTVLREIIVHYYEKLFILVKTYEAYWIAKNRIDMGASLEVFEEARQTNKGVFLGQSHFGATYLMGIALMAQGVDINVVGNFPDPAGTLMQQQTSEIVSRYNTGTATLINLAEEGTDVPMEMIRAFLTKKILSNVYDENNQFSKPVTLLGRPLLGGSGMDKILKNFSDDKLIVATPFLVRTSDETFRYELDRHTLSKGDIIDKFYASLEARIEHHYAQWYFIHELHHSIPTKL
ncbi:MAG: hypothetical protein QNJ97_04500 [Myxococcota bacterium]|nr:hypothetical protein [Myxococcota bacterium]